MSSAAQYYISTLLVYLGVDILSVWSLNLQYGLTGIYNFSWIMFQAIGAYTAGVLTLGPSSGNGGFQHYVLGTTIPFPVPLLIAGAVAGLFSIPVGYVALRRLRADYQAMVMLVISVIATLVVENVAGLFNGTAGISLIPQPLASTLNTSALAYQWFYVLITAVVCVIVYVFVHRVTSSPLGRALRAVRDNEAAAEALGKHVTQLRMF
ncbi:MAG TPA: branched-chain amino acid ABC transporter permease, partial [Vicinamibacterales bacterium]